jgi:DNA adenine methylase
MRESSPVSPLRGLAPYVGGKRVLAAQIVRAIERVPHSCYVEPFVGMGGVFFRRRSRPRLEVINDYSGDVATLFRVLQRHYLAFVEMLRWQLTTRAEFERLVATDPTTLTDLERAARFFYLQKTAFGGKVSGRNFGVSRTESGAFDVTRIVPELEAYHERLAGVVIERLPFAECLRRYDREGTLFYLDPPYWGSEHYYGRALFQRADYEVLAGVLQGLKGRFLMTLNDHAEVRRIFGRLALKKLSVTYSVHGQGRAKKAAELLITAKR